MTLLRTAKSSSCVLDRHRYAEQEQAQESTQEPKRSAPRTRQHDNQLDEHEQEQQHEHPPTTWPTGLTRRGRSELTLPTQATVDRRLVQEYEAVTAEIDRLTRATPDRNSSTAILGENDEAFQRVQRQLRRAKRNSSLITHNQTELLEKIERQERSRLRRMFTINPQGKMERLRSRLCEKLSESEAVDEQLVRLERQSMSMTHMSFLSGMGMGMSVGSAAGTESDELAMLECERDRLVTRLLESTGRKEIQDVRLRLTSYAAERTACECAMRQVEQVECLYRRALQLLRTALATIVAPHYGGSLKEFFLYAFPPAIEAGQLISQSTRLIQPEAQRRYNAYAPELSAVRPPRFPQAILDFAKRSRGDYHSTSSLSMEAARKLRHAENVVVLTQRLVVQRLETVEAWHHQVEEDLQKAQAGYRQMDERLKERVSVLARSISV